MLVMAKGLAKAFSQVNGNDGNTETMIEPEFTYRLIPLTVVEEYVISIDICKQSSIADISSSLKDAFVVLTVE